VNVTEARAADREFWLRSGVISLIWVPTIPFLFVPIDNVGFFLLRGACIGFMMGVLQMILLRKVTSFEYAHAGSISLPVSQAIFLTFGLWCSYEFTGSLGYIAYLPSYSIALLFNFAIMLLIDRQRTMGDLKIVLLMFLLMFMLMVGMSYAIVFGLYFATLDTLVAKSVACVLYPVFWEVIKGPYEMVVSGFMNEGKTRTTMQFLVEFCTVAIAALPYRAIFLEFESWGEFLAIFLIEICYKSLKYTIPFTEIGLAISHTKNRCKQYWKQGNTDDTENTQTLAPLDRITEEPAVDRKAAGALAVSGSKMKPTPPPAAAAAAAAAKRKDVGIKLDDKTQSSTGGNSESNPSGHSSETKDSGANEAKFRAGGGGPGSVPRDSSSPKRSTETETETDDRNPTTTVRTSRLPDATPQQLKASRKYQSIPASMSISPGVNCNTYSDGDGSDRVGGAFSSKESFHSVRSNASQKSGHSAQSRLCFHSRQQSSNMKQVQVQVQNPVVSLAKEDKNADASNNDNNDPLVSVSVSVRTPQSLGGEEGGPSMHHVAYSGKKAAAVPNSTTSASKAPISKRVPSSSSEMMSAPTPRKTSKRASVTISWNVQHRGGNTNARGGSRSPSVSRSPQALRTSIHEKKRRNLVAKKNNEQLYMTNLGTSESVERKGGSKKKGNRMSLFLTSFFEFPEAGEEKELLQKELAIKFFFQGLVDFVDIFGMWVILVVMRYAKIGIPPNIETPAWKRLNEQYAVAAFFEICVFVGGIAFNRYVLKVNFTPIVHSKPVLRKHTLPTAISTFTIAVVVAWVCFNPGDRTTTILN